MGKVKNVLFIMCDQLRADHLSCAGHPHLKTPAIDGLARHGVLFPRAYVQSGVCGPSRMSYYTGRYMFSHGATWNRVPLSVRERTIGDYLLPTGMRVALAGKTHVLPDTDGLERYGIEGGSALAALMRTGRFEELDRYDGHSPPGTESGQLFHLRGRGLPRVNSGGTGDLHVRVQLWTPDRLTEEEERLIKELAAVQKSVPMNARGKSFWTKMKEALGA